MAARDADLFFSTGDILIGGQGNDNAIADDPTGAGVSVVLAEGHGVETVLGNVGGDTLDASAMAARQEFRGVLAAAGGADAAVAIVAAFATSRGGRNLVDLGMQADLPAAAAVDSLPVVPRLDRGRGPKDGEAGWLLPDAADPA